MLSFKKSGCLFVFVTLVSFCFNCNQIVAQCHEDDWTALKALYESTGGDNWIETSGWEVVKEDIKPDSCNLGDLFGITLDEIGRVYSINLDTNKLKGSIPNQITSLINLRYLNLKNHWNLKKAFNDTTIYLRGTIPDSLNLLINLEYINLAFHNLDGEIPNELTQLSNLETLALYGNKLTGNIPTEISKLTNLKEVHLAGNMFSGEIPSGIGKLDSLKWLYLNGNQLSGEISENIMCKQSLIKLSLSDNKFTGNIPVCNNIENKSQLTDLFLNENQLSGIIPSQIGNFQSLEKLNLSYNKLIGYIPSQIGQLKNLKRLFLSNNQLIGAIPSTIKSMDSLRILFINENQLSDKIPTEIGELDSLEQLWLSNNYFNGSIPYSICQLKNLNFLYLSNNELSGKIPDCLDGLTKLEKLGLSRNYLTGIIPESINNIDSLKQLWLNYNRLTGKIPVGLGSIRKGFAHNNFTCQQINEFVDSTNNNNANFFMPQIFTPLNYDSIKIVTFNDSVNLTAEFSENDDNSTYQWFVNGDTLENETNGTLLIENIDSTNVGIYSLSVKTDCAGSKIDFVSKPIYVIIDGLDLKGQPVKLQQLVVEFDNKLERDSVFSKIKADPLIREFTILDSCKFSLHSDTTNNQVLNSCEGIPLIYLLEFDSLRQTQSAALIINQKNESIKCPAEVDTLLNSNYNGILTEIDIPDSNTDFVYKLPDGESSCTGGDTVSIFILDTGINESNVNSSAPNLSTELTGCNIDTSYFYSDSTINKHGTFGYKLISNKNSCVKITPLRIFDSEGKSTIYKLACALYTAIENEADIINISAGYAGQPSAILEDAIRVARDKGIFVVTSAGNDNVNLDNEPQFPAYYAGRGNLIVVDDISIDNNATNYREEIKPYDNLITVASIKNKDNNPDAFSDFSNYGKESATITAYGEDLFAYNLFCESEDVFAVSGTSMAAFLVTRQLALAVASNSSRNYKDTWLDFENRYLDTLIVSSNKEVSKMKKLKIDLEKAEINMDSCIVGIFNYTDLNDEHSIVLYPNPANNSISFDCFAFKASNWKIIDILGNTVKFGSAVSASKSVSIEAFANGLYYIILFDEAGVGYRKSFVVMH